MVGRRKVISSPHSRPISPLITLPPMFRLPRGSQAPGTSITRDLGRDRMSKKSRKFPAAQPRKGTRHGLADPIVTPQNPPIEKAAGGSVANHFRLFIIPGMDHLRPACADGAEYHRGRLRPADPARKMGRGRRCAGQPARNQSRTRMATSYGRDCYVRLVFLAALAPRRQRADRCAPAVDRPGN
jgi:hypothetical protein